MPDSEPRCTSRHLHTGKRCVLVPGHMAGHRWWRVRDPERPSWMDGEGRIEEIDCVTCRVRARCQILRRREGRLV